MMKERERERERECLVATHDNKGTNKESKSLVASLMKEIEEEERNNKESSKNSLSKTMSQINNIMNENTMNENIMNENVMKENTMNENMQNGEMEETYMIQTMNEHKSISEVLYLGKLNRENFVNSNKERDEIKGEATEYVCCTETDSTDLHFVSTNDDYKVKFKLTRDTCCMPNTCSKVYLMAQNEKWNIDNKEVILISDRLMPDGLRMDDNLNRLNGPTCETFVYNSTDKRINVYAGQTICSGIILDQKTMSVESEAFCCLTRVEENQLEKEIGNLHFPQAKEALMNLLKEYRDVLAIEGDKLGRTDAVKHRIILEENAQPFFIPYYRLPFSQREKIEEMIKDMKRDGVVRPSNSPYNSPLLLVPKKDGTWRMVIDYRKLNKQTVPDRFPMPVINDVLAQLGGAKIFSSLDLLSGYWQIPLDEESKPLTAFSTHLEHLEFQVLPFGLMNAPLAFSLAMLAVLGDIKNVFIYIDDVIIYSENLEEHLKTLAEVLDRLQKAGLKIKIKKCQFLQKELEYLGHTLNEEGVKMQAGKVKAIIEYPAPSNIKAVRRFLGMIGYYRPFIQNFAAKAYPITNLLKQENKFEWEKEQQESFELLKNCLMKDPILVYPDFTKEFFLACDASSTGLGAVLLQKNKSRMRVISYASRVLNATEQRYSVTEKECLGVVWGLKKYRHLILGYNVNILTDHKPILDLFKKRDFINNQKFNRWFLAILEYGPEFKYIPGRSNTLADGLSRAFEEEEKSKIKKMECFTCQVVDLSLELVREEQQKDPEIREIMGNILQDKNSKPDFQIIEGMLYKKPSREQEVARLYIPKTLVPEVMKLIHSHKLAGHPGLNKSSQILSRNYYWKGCRNDLENFIRDCDVCNLHKGNVNVPAPLEHYPTQLYPFQVVCMDFMGPLPTTYRGNKNLLVFVDYLTRYVEIVPVKDRMAGTVAEALKSRIITRHSAPEVLMSDNAPEFTGEIMQKLCSFYEIKKCEITPYKPSSNGAVERVNGKIKTILRTLITPETVDWDIYVEDVQLVINNSINVTTGETPHFLLYGYTKRLPIALHDDAKPPRHIYNYEDYIEQRLRQYYHTTRKTREMIKNAQRKNEKYYKCKEKKELRIGSKVYILKMVSQGPNVKVSPKFEGPYRVIEILSNNKYKVINERDLKERIAHYNNLKIVKCDDNWQKPLQVDSESEENGGNETSTPSGLGNRYNVRKR